MKSRSDTDLSLVVLGLLGWVAAAVFGGFPLLTTVAVEGPGGGKATTPNTAAAGAACGFGVGGGLCFLAAGLASRRATPDRPDRPS